MKKNPFVNYFLFFGILSLSFLVWGFSMGRYEVFPFPQIQAVKSYFLPFTPEYQLETSENPHREMDISHFKTLDSRPSVVMLGDSITAGAEWQELFPDVVILNRGIGGDTSVGVLERLNEIANRMPKAVFLLIGINDLGRGESVDNVFENYRAIIISLESRNISVFVQSTILPGGNIVRERHQQVADLNEKLKLFCNDRPSSSFINLNKVLAPEGALNGRYTLDGIHLNGDGYLAWAKLISPYIERFEKNESYIRSPI